MVSCGKYLGRSKHTLDDIEAAAVLTIGVGVGAQGGITLDVDAGTK
jgi:hypothetical protein